MRGCAVDLLRLPVQRQTRKLIIGIGWGIETLQNLQHLLKQQEIVRIELAAFENAEILQGGGSLIAAVLFAHIQEGAAANQINVQQFIENVHKVPHGDRRVNIHDAVFIHTEVGNVFFGFQREGVAGGQNKVFKQRERRSGLRHAVGAFPVQEGVSLQFHRIVQNHGSPVRDAFHNVVHVRNQISKLDRGGSGFLQIADVLFHGLFFRLCVKDLLLAHMLTVQSAANQKHLQDQQSAECSPEKDGGPGNPLPEAFGL